MRVKRDYPHGRTRPDSVAQIFRNREFADLCAVLLRNMTGEDCDVVHRGSCYILLRCVNERWERA